MKQPTTVTVQQLLDWLENHAYPEQRITLVDLNNARGELLDPTEVLSLPQIFREL